MQTQPAAETERVVLPRPKLYWTRTIISGLLILGLGVLYFGVIFPAANAVTVVGGRLPFYFETYIYTLFVALASLYFFYRLARPKEFVAEPVKRKIDADRILGMGLRSLFSILVAASYVTGAMIATPQIFQFLSSITGPSATIFGSSLHADSTTSLTFAASIILVGISLVVYEIVRVVRRKQSLRDWFANARYPENKILYWLFGLGVIFQGILGLFLLGGTPFFGVGLGGLLGNNSYSLEILVRQFHGPMGAVLISLFYAQVYLRIRPEFSIRSR